MKKRMVRILSLLLVCLIASPAFAHSGRTDSSGGHNDNKNKSGLGSYHYHCGGHPAHLHEHGICPYSPKDSISINNAPSKMYVGDSQQLGWDVTTYSGSSDVDWSSSDASVVSVDGTGYLTALSAGKATITAELYNGEKSFNITVSNRAVEKVEVSLPQEDAYVGDILNASAEITPNNATDQSISWSSSNEDVAIAMNDGTIVFIGEGETTITATALDGSKKTGSVKMVATANAVQNVDTDSIMDQLPANYVFSVKPGSSAANFVRTYSLPFEYAMPSDFPLQKGSKSTTVKDIQAALIALGFLNDKADGVWGNNTEAAVADFCDAYGLEYMGYIDSDGYLTIMESQY